MYKYDNVEYTIIDLNDNNRIDILDYYLMKIYVIQNFKII
jgi:hypothetical protein